MKYFKALVAIVLVLNASLFLTAHVALAKQYDLVPPSGTLTRGQDVQFIVDINTEGQTVTSDQIGLTYQAQYLTYKSVTPGDAMTSLDTPTVDASKGTIILTGHNSSGFTGSGVFAYVTFTLTATGPGTAQLCAIFVPSPSPSPAPTAPPRPTALPKTGATDSVNLAGLIGIILFVGSAGSFIALQKTRYQDYPHDSHKK